MRGCWALVLALALALVSVPAAGVATACACGALVSADSSLRVADETALLALRDGVETVVMRLNLDTAAADAALVVPTPAPATVTAAEAGLFDELARLSAPRVETVRRWTWGWANAEGPSADGAMAGGAPTVVRQVQLGPLEATTLSGGELAGVQKWLRDNGYQLRPEISAGLAPYLAEGWSVVAMRLTTDSGADGLDGPLAPVTLSFDSDELVYPMRMSAHASTPQTVQIYTLGEHKMHRTDPDVASQTVTLDYAGPLAGRSHSDTLRELSRDGDYLTKTTTSIFRPEEITSDFRLEPAPDDAAFQRVVYDYEYRNLTLPALGGVAAATAFVVAWTVVQLVRWVRRRSVTR